jgi:hypothetical protein
MNVSQETCRCFYMVLLLGISRKIEFNFSK